MGGGDRRLRTAGLAVLATLATIVPARADVQDYLGRTIADVRVEIGGAVIQDGPVLDLIATRVGQPLAMTDVRETIDHLVGIGRFADVRVFAGSTTAPANSVSVRWSLVPIRRVGTIEMTGAEGFGEGTLRAAVAEQFGAAPAIDRVPDIARFVADYYARRGYRGAVAEPRMTDAGARELVTLVLAVTAGPRTTIASTAIDGVVDRPIPTLLSDLRLEAGRPYDSVAIEERIASYENELRAQGYYEADVRLTPAFVAPDAVNLTLAIARGPRVRVVFAGDELPANRRDELVPIRQERSVDLDLLEDASRNIEAYLRQQGYRGAESPYVREEAGGEIVLTFTVRRGPLHRLASLDVTGNAAIARTEIVPLLRLQPGEPFVDSRVATVAAALTELYRVRGFARASIKPEIAILPPAGDGADRHSPVAVRLVVTEGPRTAVGAVTVAGASLIDPTQVLSILGLASGRPYYRPQLDADRAAVERLYHNAGFRNVRVDAATTLRDDGQVLDVRWDIVEGERVVVDHVLVSGNERTSGDLIRREIVLRPGEPLGDDALIESQRRLAALGLFRRVRILELPHGAGASRDVLVEVEEAQTTTISYGGGLEAGRRLRADEGGQAEERIEIAPRGFFEVSRRNLWGKNRSLTLVTRASFRPRGRTVDSPDPAATGYRFNEYRVLTTFREPRPFDAAGDLQLTAFLEQASRTSFNFSRRGVRTDYARRAGNALTISGRYVLDRTRLFDVTIVPEEQLLIDRLFPQVRLSTFTLSLLRDSRDDVLDPTRGTVLGVDGTLAARRIGSEVGFLKSFMQAFAYRRLPGPAQLTLVAGVRLGLAEGFARLVGRVDETGAPVVGEDGEPIVDVVEDVPASERFFAGGDTTVRGFVLDRLGTADTRNAEGFPTGGNGLAVVNVEVRTPYWKGLGGVGFFDAGNVFKAADDIAFGDLRSSAGIGIRYRSPLGPLRFDLGFNLDPQELSPGTRERRAVFHISLGQAF